MCVQMKFLHPAVTGVVCKAELDSNISTSLAECGMNVIGKLLKTHTQNLESKTKRDSFVTTILLIIITVTSLVLNNLIFLHKVASFLANIRTPKVSGYCKFGG